MRYLSVIFCIGMAALSASAQEDDRPTVFGAHHGYTDNPKEERNRREYEMVMLEKPKKVEKPLSDKIFNDKLTKEFKEQFEFRFGQTQAEQVINSPVQSDDYIYYDNKTITIQEYQRYQRNFAEYMARRLTEFHVDNWAKSDPDVKKVYEVKDRVSNLNMEVSKGYKFTWKYNFSGPFMDFRFENPYDVDARIRVEMSGVVSSPDEVIYTLGYQLTKTVRLSALHRQYDGIYQLVCSKQLTRHLSTSLTGSTDQQAFGPIVQQDLVLVGFTWSE